MTHEAPVEGDAAGAGRGLRRGASRWVSPALGWLATLPPVVRTAEAVSAGRASILMFHRFRHVGDSIEGLPSERLRRLLGYLRKHRYCIVDLDSLANRLLAGEPTAARSVALTFDDGYADQFEMAIPALTEFDAPATIFLTTGFVDGELWLWWDQIEHVIQNTARPEVAFRIDGQEHRYPIGGVRERTEAVAAIAEQCKQVQDEERRAVIESVARAGEVELPVRPPPKYQPISWDQVRASERFGVRAGPGTVSHPILARSDAGRSAWEILESWRRVQAEVRRPMPVFCFPNGRPEDFSDREIQSVRDAGLTAAVSTVRAYATPGTSLSPVAGVLTMPRYSGETTFSELVRIVSGVEHWVERARHLTGRS